MLILLFFLVLNSASFLIENDVPGSKLIGQATPVEYKNFQWSTLTSGTLALTPTEKELANGKAMGNVLDIWY